jgi:1-deoxy-D-xylulose-5-phosphate reductoisomerase
LELSPDGPLIFNAANEVAVAAFLAREIGFMDIPVTIERCLENGQHRFVGAIEDMPLINLSAMAFCQGEMRAARVPA